MKPAAIAANLVDVRNIAAHKCVRLEIHVPAEQASIVLAAFGWPTAVDPIPVAIARLETAKGASEPSKTASEARPRRRFEDLPLPQQAAICCQEPAFWRFLAEEIDGSPPDTAEEAAEYVRHFCAVNTRADIREDGSSGRLWRELHARYELWKRAAEHVA